jgi:chemotaxis protein MotB
MRAQARRIAHDEEEESAFISMTDMTVGFLFIMMILLAFFASQIREPDAVSRDVHETIVAERDYWRDIAASRADTIVRLNTDIEDLTQQKAALVIERDQYAADLEVALSKNETLKSRNNELNDRLKELEAIIADLRDQIEEKDQEIERLQSELDRLKQVDPLEEYLARVANVRREVLLKLRDAIRSDFPDLQVELSEESDALRFQGEGLFGSGRADLTAQKRDIVAKLALRLDEVLPCFTSGERSQYSQACNPSFVMIEAVQIEGHTDNVGTDVINRTLSTSRANNTFFAMTNAAPMVMDHRNLKKQPVLSVAAYGPDRPVATNETPAGRATNRRIDLRFIMVTPQDTDGIATIRAALKSLSGETE